MKNRQLSLIIFICIQLYIYISIASLSEYINPKVMILSSSIICLGIALFMFCKTRDYFIMLAAIILSLISDTFITVISNLKIISFIILNLVQILYFLRIYLDSEYKKSNLIYRIIFIPLLISLNFIILKDNVTIYSILWTTFITNLFINILFTIKEIGLNNLFPIGLLFLFIYGSSIMFMQLENYVSININFINFLNNLSFDITYIFYIPAQTILTCSIFTVNRRCFSRIKQDEE